MKRLRAGSLTIRGLDPKKYEGAVCETAWDGSDRNVCTLQEVIAHTMLQHLEQIKRRYKKWLGLGSLTFRGS